MTVHLCFSIVVVKYKDKLVEPFCSQEGRHQYGPFLAHPRWIPSTLPFFPHRGSIFNGMHHDLVISGLLSGAFNTGQNVGLKDFGVKGGFAVKCQKIHIFRQNRPIDAEERPKMTKSL